MLIVPKKTYFFFVCLSLTCQSANIRSTWSGVGIVASITNYADTKTAHEVLDHFFDWCQDVAGFLSGWDFLEIGAGAGHVTVEILKRGGNVKAIVEPNANYLKDLSDRVQLYISREAEPDIHRRIWRLGGFWDIKIQDINAHFPPNMMFDFFMWANGIHYLEKEEDLTQFFQHMKYRARYGGFFCTSFWTGSVDRKAFSVLGRMTRFAIEYLGLDPKGEGVPVSRRLHEWSLADYKRFARLAGYQTVDIEQVVMQLPVDVYQGIAHDVTWVDNALPPIGALAKFTQEQRIEALVVGAEKAYEYAGVETTQRIWAFFRVA